MKDVKYTREHSLRPILRSMTNYVAFGYLNDYAIFVKDIYDLNNPKNNTEKYSRALEFIEIGEF